MMHSDKKKSLATLIVGSLKGPKEDAPNQEKEEESSYNDKAECLKDAFAAMQEGDFELASMHLSDFHTLAHEEEDMMMSENPNGYKEKEV